MNGNMAIMMILMVTASGAPAFADEQDPPLKQNSVKAADPSWEQDKPPSPTPTPTDPSQKSGAEPEIKVSLRDGVHFKSADGNFDIILGGYVGIHYRVFAHRPHDNVRTSPDTWYIRQARPELSGFIYKDFDFRVQLDFPTGPAAINGTTQDVYAGWRRYPELSFRVGQFKEPFGQEQTTPDRYLDFNERSEGDRFTPQRDLGAMVYGTLLDGVFTYELGYFNGQGRAVLDQNKGKEEAGRFRVQPFAGSTEGSLLKYLRFGVAGTVAAVQKQSMSAFTSNSSYLNITYITANGATALDGQRTRWGGELTWNYGPFGLRGEAWRRVDTVDAPSAANQKLRTDAWSVEATGLVTGERKPIEGRVIPTHPFDPTSDSWGALEVAARVDRLHIDSDIFTLGFATAAGNANVVTGYSLAVNWYLTRNIRISPNVYWEVFNDPILFSTGQTDRHFFGGILRFQLEF
jgi:phosphate-selective porin OprO/OprP